MSNSPGPPAHFEGALHERRPMSHDREIVAAALRWSTANARRLEIGAIKRKADKAYKLDGDLWSPLHNAGVDAAARLTPARRTELAALRALAKACAKARALHVDDADMVIDVPARLTFKPTSPTGHTAHF